MEVELERVKARQSRAIFWALAGTFVMTASVFLVPPVREVVMGFAFIAVSGVMFFLLGVALIFLTVKGELGGIRKRFLILTGASAAAFPVSVLLHNAVYGLFICWFGVGFWERVGLGDEPFFFFMAIVVCPAGFLVGSIGSIVLAIKSAR